jgi:hypothetical protein
LQRGNEAEKNKEKILEKTRASGCMVGTSEGNNKEPGP